MKYKILMIIMIITLSTIGCTKTSTLSKEEKAADFEQLYDEIKDGYPFLEVNKRQNKLDWLSNKQDYKQIIVKTSSDQDFADKLDAMLKDLHNGHTEVINNKIWFNEVKKVYKPFGWYDFFDDKNVNNMYNSLKKGEDYGKESYKDIKLKDLVKGKIGYICIPQINSSDGNIDDDMKRITSYLEKIQNYKSLVIDIRGNTGGTDEYWKKLVSVITDKTYTCGGYRLFRNTSNVIRNYTKIRKVKLNDINKLPKNIIINAPKEVKSMFTHFEYNNEIIKGQSKTPFNGKIYLLVNNSVFSGAEAFSIFCKEHKFAKIVGSKTGGDGYIYDPVLFKLKNSGLIVRMASTMYLTNNGICNEEEKTTPDIKIENENTFGSDTVYINKILELEKTKE